MNKADIRIMASPKRAERVKLLVEKLGLSDSAVTWDDRPKGGGAMYTARKAWLFPIPDWATHRVVLNDDVLVCDNFLDIVEQIAVTHPDCAVGLCNFVGRTNYLDLSTPYFRTRSMCGCGIMLPKSIIEPCMKYIDEFPDSELKKIDDYMISKYCFENKITMLTVLPTIIQHPDDDSLLSVTYSWKRTSKNYDELGRGDWLNRQIANETEIPFIRRRGNWTNKSIMLRCYKQSEVTRWQ